MADFTTINTRYNSAATDSGATFTGNIVNFGGSSGANELRFCQSTSGAASNTPSATWPYVTRPTSGTQVINQLWGFTGDTSGAQIQTYDGTNAHYAQLQFNWDNSGTWASAPTMTAYGDNTHTNPVAGTQPGAFAGSPIVNGSTDTSNTSYLKATVYGLMNGAAPSANQALTLSATSGSAGAVTSAATTWTAWQSMQGTIQYIQNGATPAATTAGQWYFLLALYTGVTMSTGNLTPVITLAYSYT